MLMSDVTRNDDGDIIPHSNVNICTKKFAVVARVQMQMATNNRLKATQITLAERLYQHTTTMPMMLLITLLELQGPR